MRDIDAMEGFVKGLVKGLVKVSLRTEWKFYFLIF